MEMNTDTSKFIVDDMRAYLRERFTEHLKSQQSGDSIPAVEEDFMQVASGRKTFEELEAQPVEPVEMACFICGREK